MSSHEFRFAYFTPIYEETVAFYRDGLGLALSHSWDRSTDDRGTVIKAASGLIEVLAFPRSGDADHLFDDRAPQGAFIVIQVDDVDQIYARALEKGLPVRQQPKDQAWGHRSVCLEEPNGLRLFFFTPIAPREL
jgi:catechol 2,3-dioxygenase-like lactoylglutathione lyase family enzyme